MKKSLPEMISRRRAISLRGWQPRSQEPFVKVRFAIADEMIE
jgi:hypothetical protein